MGCIAGADDIPAPFKGGMLSGVDLSKLRGPCWWNSNDVAHSLQTINVNCVKSVTGRILKSRKNGGFKHRYHNAP
jgi:hypothetical protein